MHNSPHPVCQADALGLVAAFAVQPSARESWKKFCEQQALDDLNPALMPIILKNLRLEQKDEEEHSKFTGVMRGYCRFQWCKNQKILKDLSVVLRNFRDQRADAVVGGDFAIIHHSGDDFASRQMSNIELIVSSSDVERCNKTLNQLKSNSQIQANITIVDTLAWNIGPRRSLAVKDNAIKCAVVDTAALTLGIEDTIIFLLSQRQTSLNILWIADVLNLLPAKLDTAILQYRLKHYRTVGETRRNLEFAGRMLENCEFERKAAISAMLEKLRVGALEEAVARTPYAGHLMAAGSRVINSITGSIPKEIF